MSEACWRFYRLQFSSFCLKSIHFWNSVFSFYENKVLQVMSAGARLERFGEIDLFFMKWRSCKHWMDFTRFSVLYRTPRFVYFQPTFWTPISFISRHFSWNSVLILSKYSKLNTRQINVFFNISNARQCWFTYVVRFANINANMKLFLLQKSKQKLFPIRKFYKTCK